MEFEGIKIHHATRAKAEKLADMLAAEYPTLSLDFETNEDESAVRQWLTVHTSEDGETVILETPKVPELADILAVCEDRGIDPEEGSDEEEEGPSGSVVPEEYRARYREVSSNGQTCGDWLAEFLTGQCHGIDGFNVHDFQAILDANEVDQSGAWAKLPESGQKGWVGRWRMNGRQALEKVVAVSGVVRGVTGDVFELPADALAELQRKHSGYLAKLAKAEAKAEAA